MRAREGSCLTRVNHPQSTKRVNLSTPMKKCVNNALHLNGIHILEGIAVSLHVHAQGGKGLEERGIRQQQVRRGDGDSRQGCHHTILSLLK